MNPNDKNEFRVFAEEHINLLKVLWQNDPMDEAKFLKFLKDRGIAAYGLFSGDPGDFHRRGWLQNDYYGQGGTPRFHPFRTYPIHRILESCRLPVTASSTLSREGYTDFIEKVLQRLPSEQKISERTVEWNHVASLAVLLEPIFWPQVIGREHYKGPMSEREYLDCRDEYHPLAMQIVETLDPEEWRKYHEQLRHDAFYLDENTDLYVLLRLSKWDRRKVLKGRIAGALWIRHIAEVLRKAFESCHSVEWPEEDQAFGQWVGDSRLVVYGSYKPFDFETYSRPSIAFRYGLYSGSAVRWYVEGETESSAVSEVLEKPEDYGIEVQNLRGYLKQRGNLGLSFQDALQNDIAIKRFSIVSFDRDRDDTVRAIRAQLSEGNIVGFIAAHQPDFEFSNFTVEELVELAAELDEQEDSSGEPLRMADWSGVRSMKEFVLKYDEVTSRQPRHFQKGERWGRILARYAIENPRRPDTNDIRLFIRTIQEATWARSSHYDTVRQYFSFDLETFLRIEVPKQELLH